VKHFRAVDGRYPMGGELVQLNPMKKNQSSADNWVKKFSLGEQTKDDHSKPVKRSELVMSTRQMTKVWGRSR
jgi:hypothetical protein